MKKKRRCTRLSRQPSPLVAQRHEALLARSRALTAEPPFWGYRRIWASWHVVEPLPVNEEADSAADARASPAGAAEPPTYSEVDADRPHTTTYQTR